LILGQGLSTDHRGDRDKTPGLSRTLNGSFEPPAVTISGIDASEPIAWTWQAAVMAVARLVTQ